MSTTLTAAPVSDLAVVFPVPRQQVDTIRLQTEKCWQELQQEETVVPLGDLNPVAVDPRTRKTLGVKMLEWATYGNSRRALVTKEVLPRKRAAKSPQAASPNKGQRRQERKDARLDRRRQRRAIQRDTAREMSDIE